MQRYQQQFHSGEESKTERDPKTDLLPRHSQKARKQEQEKDEAQLHDEDRALQGGEDMKQKIPVERIRKGDDQRNQQHDHTRPLEEESAQIFQRVIGAEHVEENLMNNLEAENRVDRLTQPEEPKIHVLIAGEPKGKDNRKIRNRRQEKQEEPRKLLVQLTAPEDRRNRRLQDGLWAPQTNYDGMAVPSHRTCRGRTRPTVIAALRPCSPSSGRLPFGSTHLGNLSNHYPLV